jgi:glycosyltransferase involved in cell wall biosynthesis
MSPDRCHLCPWTGLTHVPALNAPRKKVLHGLAGSNPEAPLTRFHGESIAVPRALPCNAHQAGLPDGRKPCDHAVFFPSMKITFVDTKCPAPYDSEALRNRGLGGTEATVIRIAQALAQRHDVTVVQHNRLQPCIESPSLQFLPLDSLATAVRDAQHVVLIQKTRLIRQVARHSSARLWVWLHNYIKDEVRFSWPDYLAYRIGIICVSRTHAQHTQRYLRRLPINWASFGMLNRGGVLYHYNPLSEDWIPPSRMTRDPHKLISLSSPHKGLDQIVEAFRSVHAVDPRLKLYVADPGYIQHFDATMLEAPGIVRLGSLPQSALLKHVQDALCVFYPQRKRPETFGLVYAEANAVGTPVLAHDFGSAREILAATNPPLDASEPRRIIDTVQTWVAEGGPVVGPNPEFSLESVVMKWELFFHDPDSFIDAQAREFQRHLTEERCAAGELAAVRRASRP